MLKNSVDDLDTGAYIAGEPKKRKSSGKPAIRKKYQRTLINFYDHDTEGQFELWWDAFKMHSKDLFTDMELEQKVFPSSSIVKSTKEYDSKKLDSFVDVLKEFRPSDLPSINGSPKVLIVTLSAIRAVDIIRSLKNIQSKFKLGKLFSKHKKLQDQRLFLDTNLVEFAVGTPDRLCKLFEECLKDDEIELLVIDTGRDAKERNIVEMPETKGKLFELVHSHLIKRLNSESCKLLFY